MEKNKIGTKQVMAFADATGYLEDLLKSFKAKKIVVKKDDEFLALVPAENVNVEVEAKTKKGKAKFSLELSWSEESGESLIITDKEPAPAKVVEEPAAPAKKEETAPVVKPEAKAPATKPAAKVPAKSAAVKGPAGPKKTGA